MISISSQVGAITRAACWISRVALNFNPFSEKQDSKGQSQRVHKLTVVLHDPQCEELELRSAHVPVQHAVAIPVHGGAPQRPQLFRSIDKFVQFPEQHVG